MKSFVIRLQYGPLQTWRDICFYLGMWFLAKTYPFFYIYSPNDEVKLFVGAWEEKYIDQIAITLEENGGKTHD